MIDLHIHTNYSDGSFSPDEIISRAKKKGLKAIAITDHDTIEGIAHAILSGNEMGIEVIAGVEISVESEVGNIHILGYFLDTDNEALNDTLAFLRNGRQERIPKILKKLADFDMPITLDEVNRDTLGGAPGRPHVAGVMYQKGYVKSMPEAFDKYLRKGAPAFVDKVKLPEDKALKIILSAGGIPVLAHPVSLEEPDYDKLFSRIETLKRRGLMGIEAYYPSHNKDQTAKFIDIAEDLGLCVTGGTDFHGRNKPDIEMGRIPHGGPLSYEIVENLRALAKANQIKN